LLGDGLKRWGYFLGQLHCQSNPLRTDNLRHPSHTTRSRNINRVPTRVFFARTTSFI
jgi:hypothetical protein